jgi:hypothetical protein
VRVRHWTRWGAAVLGVVVLSFFAEFTWRVWS